MQDNSKKNALLTLIGQNNWHIESFISLLKQAAEHDKTLEFFGAFADVLSECSTLAAVFRFQDPRSIILSFIARYKMFNKSESAFYAQVFEPVLDAMISSSPNCVYEISSSHFLKRIAIKGIKSRFDLAPPFIQFIRNVRSELRMKTS